MILRSQFETYLRPRKGTSHCSYATRRKQTVDYATRKTRTRKEGEEAWSFDCHPVAGCTRGDTNDKDTTVAGLPRSRLSGGVIVGLLETSFFGRQLADSHAKKTRRRRNIFIRAIHWEPTSVRWRRDPSNFRPYPTKLRPVGSFGCHRDHSVLFLGIQRVDETSLIEWVCRVNSNGTSIVSRGKDKSSKAWYPMQPCLEDA